MFETYERSPTRVDLAGGTLDFWPIFMMLDDPQTINVAIDIFTHCKLQARPDKKITITSRDLKKKAEFTNLQAFLTDKDADLDLIRAQVRFFRPLEGFNLETWSESPVGGGLGGSSSLCVSMIKAFSKWLGHYFDTEEMVELAHNIEAQVLGKMTGTQDYFPAILGDINVIEYGARGPKVRQLPLPSEVFAKNFLLVYTGKSHHSGINNWHVHKEFLNGNTEIIASFWKLRNISARTVKAVEAQQWEQLNGLFREEFDARCELSKEFSSPEIERVAAIANEHNATAKICGAGGGGCVMVWCPRGNLTEVADALKAGNFQVLPTKVYSYGKA